MGLPGRHARGLLEYLSVKAVDAHPGEDHGGRPLIGSARERVFQLYTQRIHLYRKYGTYTISNPKTPEEAAERIAALYRKECQP